MNGIMFLLILIERDRMPECQTMRDCAGRRQMLNAF